MIDTINLSFSYVKDNDIEKTDVLNDVNIKIDKGEFVSIIGTNGSGKSTLARHFNALLLPMGGRVIVKGMDTKDISNKWDIRQTVGMVFQNPDNQIVATTVENDVAFGPENLGIPSDEIIQRVEYALKAVDMFKYKKHASHLLSGGQKQRIAIAGIMAMKPECIILDEPTAMLDPIGRKEVLEAITKLNRKEKITVVLITHYMDEAVMADKVLVIDKGKVIMNGSPKKIFNEVENLKRIGLDVPQVRELVYELEKEGINISQEVLTVDECVNEIFKVINR